VRDRDPLTGHAPSDRRRFLGGVCAFSITAFLGRDARAASTPRRLSFVNTHTDERLAATYWADGRYEPAALREIDRILRDVRRDVVRPIDRDLLDILYTLQARLGSEAPFHVISAYRTPETNRMLRERSGRVASHSLHCDARAIDVRLPGTPLRSLHRAAVGLQRGGVGYYAASDFVHVDTGRVRSW
jgi:uncharacterized protein YcbK (DUF882 family)